MRYRDKLKEYVGQPFRIERTEFGYELIPDKEDFGYRLEEVEEDYLIFSYLLSYGIKINFDEQTDEPLIIQLDFEEKIKTCHFEGELIIPINLAIINNDPNPLHEKLMNEPY